MSSVAERKSMNSASCSINAEDIQELNTQVCGFASLLLFVYLLKFVSDMKKKNSPQGKADIMGQNDFKMQFNMTVSGSLLFNKYCLF